MSARNMAKRTAAGTLALAVCLGGGALALAGAANAAPGFKFDTRAAGDNRYLTAIDASKKAFKDGSSPDVVIVNGERSVDGLTASALAGAYNASILYANGDGKSLSKETQEELKRLGAKKIWLAGGTIVLTTELSDALAKDYTVARIDGKNRYETAALIAKATAEKVGGVDTVFIASGENNKLVDAVTVASVAYDKHVPILLSQQNTTDSATTDELGVLKSKGVKKVLALGGTGAISDDTAKKLGAEQPFQGINRAQTAAFVRDYANANWGFDKSNAALVGDQNNNIADSLVSAALLAQVKTTPLFAGQDITAKYLSDHAAELTGKGFIIGGTFAVSADDVKAAESAAQSSVAANQSFIVTSATPGSNTLKYADASANKEVTVTYADGDNFMVDGTKATVSVFESEITKGDLLSVTPAKDANSKPTYSLTTKALSDYTSGLIGAVNVGSTFTIYEPISSTSLNTVTYTGTYTIYTVDGASVSATAFGQALNIGDTVKVSGTGADAEHIRTVALTNQSVSGSVSGKSGNNFSVKTSAGTVLGTFTAGSTDKLTVDGSTKDQTAFNAALSNGDTVTVSKAGDVQTIALVNAAPAAVTGQASVVSPMTAVATAAYDGSILQAGYVTSAGADTIVLGESVTVTNTAAAGAANEKAAIDLGSAFNTTGYRSKLVLKYDTVVGSSVATGTTVTVDIPKQGTMTAGDYQAAIAAAIETKIKALAASTTQTSGATVAVDSSYVATITYGANTDVTNMLTTAYKYDAPRIFVDGSVATAAEATAALTVGDMVKWQAADSATSTSAKLDITNASLEGSVKAWSTPNITVYAAGSTTNTLSAVAYNDGTALGLPATATYTVNGVTKTSTEFTASLDSIQSGTLKGSIKITQSGTKTLYALTTSLA